LPARRILVVIPSVINLTARLSMRALD